MADRGDSWRRYAVGLHVGPFHRLAETYLDVIGRWFPASGHEAAPDAVVEHYLDDPRTTPESELRKPKESLGARYAASRSRV